jgi:alkylation response protein AidB-like acyl-CoA dehydrogenase
LKKDYAYTEEYEKSRDLGLLGVAVPEAYGGLGMGFVSTMVAITFLVQDLSQLLLSTYGNRYYANNFIWY